MRSIYLSVIMIAVLSSLPDVTPVLAQWENTGGPYGGQVGVLLSDGTNVFAETSSGAFISSDLGTTWTSAGVLNGMSDMTSIKLGSNAVYVYAVVGSALLLSTDSGSSWQSIGTIPLSASPLSIVAFPNDSGGVSLLAASGADILLSTDGGHTWSRPDSTLTDQGVDVVAASSDTGNHVVTYAGTAIGRVFASYNGGRSWSLIDSGTAGDAILSIAAEGTNILFDAPDGLFSSGDGGKTWTAAGSGLPNSSKEILGIYGNISYAGTDSGVFVSTDFGISWKPYNTGLWSLSIRSLSIDSGLAAGTRLIAGTAVGAFVSGVDSADWTPIGFPISAVFSLSTSKSYLWAATDGGIFRSTNGGGIWTEAGFASNPLDAVLALSDSLILISSPGVGILRTTDSGSSWKLIPSTTGILYGINHSFEVSGSTIYDVGSAGVLSSIDSGVTWNRFFLSGGTQCVCAFDSTVFVGTTSDGIYRTTDGGQTWSRSGPTNEVVHAIVNVAGDSGRTELFTAMGAGVYESTDDGTSWFAAGLQNRAPDVFSLYAIPGDSEAARIFAGTLYGGIYFTADNGRTWVAANSGFDNNDLKNIFRTFAVESVSGDSLYLFTGSTDVWKRPLSEMLLPPPPTPNLQSPANDSLITVDPMTLRWSSARQGDLFEVQVAYDSAFSHPLVDSAGITPDSLTLRGIRSDSLYYWRVSSSDQYGYSGWSGTWWFRTGLVTGVEAGAVAPRTFVLRQNYPNPFNPTSARYVLSYRL